MGTLTRVRDFTADRDSVPPVPISAEGVDDEFDQLVIESNAQDVRLDTLDAITHLPIDATMVATDTHIMVADGTDFDNVALSGDATLSNTGVLTIANDAIDSQHYADLSVDLGHLAADSVDGTKIVDDAINSEHYTNGSIDLIHMSADSVDGSKIVDAAINSEHYTNGSIDLIHMSADSVDGSKIVDDAINSEHYTNGSIDLIHLSADSVDGSKIADDSINSEHYAAGSIDSEHLSADCVVSATVDDDSLVNADINSSAAIDATKIHNGTVTNTEFGYINTLSSNVQTQIDNIVAGTVEDVKDNVFTICDDLDSTKDIAFQASGITSGNTRTITMADQNIDLTPDTGTYQSAGSGVSAGFSIAMAIAL